MFINSFLHQPICWLVTFIVWYFFSSFSRVSKLIHSFVRLFVHSFIHSFILSFFLSFHFVSFHFIRSFVRLFVCSIIRSFHFISSVDVFIHSLIRSVSHSSTIQFDNSVQCYSIPLYSVPFYSVRYFYPKRLRSTFYILCPTLP